MDSNRAQERIIVLMRDEILNHRQWKAEQQAKTRRIVTELDLSVEREKKLIECVHVLHDNFNSLKESTDEKLQQATIRERALTEKNSQLTKLLEELKIQVETVKSELSIMKSTRDKSSANDEAESLKFVIEMKQCKISQLSKSYSDLQRLFDEASAAKNVFREKSSVFAFRVEDLQVQLQAKSDKEE